MSSIDERLEDLLRWARENLPQLRHEASAVVADQLGDEVLRVDGQLGVEVGDDSPVVRDVIVTAFSEPTRFSLVRRITALLGELAGWQFIPLKPPRGFEFRLTAGEQQISASSLEFAPFPEIEGGIHLVAPRAVIAELPEKEAEELAWLVVETGIGEELAGRLQHIDFSGGDGIVDRHSVRELEEYVRRHLPGD